MTNAKAQLSSEALIGMERATEVAIKANGEVVSVAGRPCSLVECLLKPSVKTGEWFCRRREFRVGRDDVKGIGSVLEGERAGEGSSAESGESS